MATELAHPTRTHPHDHDDTVEAHYACLERPCACIEGWVFVGYIDEDGEEQQAVHVYRRFQQQQSEEESR